MNDNELSEMDKARLKILGKIEQTECKKNTNKKIYSNNKVTIIPNNFEKEYQKFIQEQLNIFNKQL